MGPILEPNSHTYTLDNKPIPGVNEVLKANGLISFIGVRPEVLERAQKFGNAVHKACELSDKNDLAIDMLAEPLKPYLNQWLAFRKHFEIWETEYLVYSRKYYFAGTLDRVGILKFPTLLEIKTDNIYTLTASLQTAGYLIAWNEMHPEKKIRKRIAIILSPEKFRIEEYNNEGDIEDFIACRRVYELKKKHNIRR